ncbi:hypothetical protein, partial [Streptomyces telluris]|uniref:hypothetical protein n=1 Tax=Streptomyces telluris TaxID=2720021 RepID=UPI0019D085CD
MQALGKEAVQQCSQELRRWGTVRLDGLTDRDAAARFAARVMRIQRSPESGPDGLASTGKTST